MLIVQAIDSVEVVGDEKHDKDPLQTPRSLHTKYYHEDHQLGEQERLQDRIVPQQADCVIVLIQLRKVCLYFFCG